MSVPSDIVSQLEARGPEACPYCLAWMFVPCVLHRVSCGCDRECGDDGDVDGPGTCKGLPMPPREPLVRLVTVRR